LDLRAGDIRRLLRGVERDAGAAYAADVGHQRHQFGNRGRRPAGGRRQHRGGPRRRRHMGQGARLRSACAGLDQHLRRLPGDPAHAWHVQAQGAVMSANIVALLILFAGILFILALRGLSHPETSRRGNQYGMLGMAIAVVTTLFVARPDDAWTWALIVVGIAIGGVIGAVIARRIPMTAMPQLVAGFHSLVGLAAVLVAAAALDAPGAFGIGEPGRIHVASLIEMSLGAAIGAVTFTGSIVAFTKLQGLVSGAPVVFAGQHKLNLALGIAIVAIGAWFAATESHSLFWLLTLLALVIGVLIIIPIGGADMPVVISMLNSYSGWAAAGIGFTLGNTALIITGALVGSSGAILSYIMCRGMNRSFFNVILGGFGGETAGPAAGAGEERPVKQGSAEDAAFLLRNAGSVIIVPGYGMAVAQAQHALKEMADLLKK